MKTFFKRLCLTCFCIVLAAVPHGIFELVYLNDPGSTLLGCRVGEYANIHCGDAVLSHVKEIVLNLPFGFVIAPAIGARPSVLGIDSSNLRAYMHPVLVYLYVLDLVLVLASIHLLRMIVRLTVGRWKS